MAHWTFLHWSVFSIIVLVSLGIDLFGFHREDREPSLKASFGWSVFWISLAVIFGGLIWYWTDSRTALLFFTGYLVEKSLSMDNVFVFVVIFEFFRVPLKYHYRVLFWGILIAIVLRLIFIVAGIELVKHFEWVMVIFGAFLIYSGIKLIWHDSEEVNPETNWVVKITRKLIPISTESHGGKFVVREGGKLVATPLFLVFVVINFVDVVFAVDSIPAIFGITRDPFIVFTSNVLAILGLRALYFLLAGFVKIFRFLRFGLCAILVFIGAKMLIEYFFASPGHGPGHTEVISSGLSLVVVVSLLTLSIGASVIFDHVQRKGQTK